jgi:acyl-CoA thioesterase-1
MKRSRNRPARRCRLLAAALMLLGGGLPATAAEAEPCAAPAELVRLQSQLPRTALRLTQHSALHIVALGSSSTAGTGASAPDRTYPAQLASELHRRLPADPIEIVNKGVGGETAIEMLARFDRDVFAIRPDLVIWQVGTNAVLRNDDLERDLALVRDGVHRLKAAGIDVILMDMQYAPRVLEHSAYSVVETGLSKIAKEEGVAVFRRFEIMQHWVQAKQLDFATMLSPDQLHLNDTSYGCVGRLLARAIVQRTSAPVLTSRR